MAVESTMAPLGSAAPDFELVDVISRDTVSLSSVRSNMATVVMFICNHCPYVKHVQGQLVAVAHDYQPKGVSFVAINANDADQYPEDGPDRMAAVAAEQRYPFPYLHDQTQAVARAYGAVCTPDLFVYDGDLALAYRGRLDASTPGNGQPNDGADLRRALDALVAGHPVPADQVPSMGCSIKWR
jgi:thiol-disulfide isomerase/thioredoxin